MSYSPRTFVSWRGSGKKHVPAITALFKNAVSAAVLAIFGSKTSIAVIRCLLSMVIVAVMLFRISEIHGAVDGTMDHSFGVFHCGGRR
ncbi:MAG: hypothetical protein LAO30_13620 [Acidobacteriia bacterium]|nr:hypothetical protein [Terriglobia bacterium]